MGWALISIYKCTHCTFTSLSYETLQVGGAYIELTPYLNTPSIQAVAHSALHWNPVMF
jgi:hypothetical protein